VIRETFWQQTFTGDREMDGAWKYLLRKSSIRGQ